MDLTLYIGNYTVNSETPIDASRWQMPDTRGYQVVDLVRLNLQEQGAIQVPGVQAPTFPTVSYRGFETRRATLSQTKPPELGHHLSSATN